jgi:hypothetical protein
VVTSKGDDPRVILAIKRDWDKRLACDRVVTQRRKGRSLKEGLVAIFYLLNGMLIVVWGDRNVSYNIIML